MADNLPANVALNETSPQTSLSRMISIASADEVDRLLHAEPVTARKLAERLRIMRQLYYATDASEAERKALLMVWTDALSKIPAPFVIEAFREWFATGTHKPTPGHIRSRALDLERHARTRRENLSEPPFRARLSAPQKSDAEIEAEVEAARESTRKWAEEFPMLKPMPKPEEDGE